MPLLRLSAYHLLSPAMSLHSARVGQVQSRAGPGGANVNEVSNGTVHTGLITHTLPASLSLVLLPCALCPATGEEVVPCSVAVRRNRQSAVAVTAPVDPVSNSGSSWPLLLCAALCTCEVRPEALRTSAELNRLFTKGETRGRGRPKSSMDSSCPQSRRAHVSPPPSLLRCVVCCGVRRAVAAC